MVDTPTTALFTALQADRTALADALDRPALRGIKNVLTDLTQGEAHFIYELLQNADDARATQVRFCLLPEGLSVWHNAPHKFTISDVATEEEDTGTAQLGHLNALTSIGNSTKRRGTSSVDSDTIGRFGIGFKSVFHYTATPHVYEDDLSFRLERILVPVPLTDRNALPPGLERGGAEWTQLWLPFNHVQRPAAEAYQHVLGRLRTLRLPLLFLRHLTEISWEARPVFQELITDSGYYLRETPRLLTEQAADIRVEYVELIQEDRCTNTDTGDEVTVAAHRFVVVKQPCHGHLNLPVCLAFALRDNGTLDPSADDRGHEAFCFFATRHRTGLRFLLQAPWLLTNNREAIKADQPWNQQLVQQLAQLLAASLPLLRDLRPADLARPGTSAAPFPSLLTDELLQLLPLSEAPDAERRTVEELRQRQELSFRPFHAAVFEALRTLPLLPTATGTHIGATHAYYAESRDLSQAFGQEQLRQLTQDPAAEWVFDSVGGKENKSQTAYLKRLLPASHLLEPKEAASRLTAAFMEAQTDEWLTAFYVYLSTGPGYLLDGQNDAILRHRGALLRLANDKHLAPYAAARDTEPQVFLPPTSGGFQSSRTLKACFTQDEQLASFRRRLGLTTPKQLTVVLEYVLPQYTGAEGPSLDDHLEHVKQILDCWQTCSQQEQAVLRKRLLDTSFIRGYAYPSATPEYHWYRPGQLYQDNEDLRQYFAASKTVFVAEAIYAGMPDASGIRALWQALRVATFPRIIKLENQPITADDYVALYKVRSTSTDDQYVTNHDLDGLAGLLSQGSVSKVLSQALFGFLGLCIEHAGQHLFDRVYTFWHYNKPYNTITASQALQALQQTTWLYDQTGQLRHAHEFATADVQLADGYPLDTPAAQELLRRLDILSPRQKVLDGLPAAERELVEFFREMKAKGLTTEEIRAAISKLRPASPVVPPTPAAEPLADQERKQTWQATRDTASFPPPTAAAPTSSAAPAAEAAAGDDDDYLSEGSRRKLLRAQQQVHQLEDELRQQDELFREVEQAERYTYGWFQALLTLETRLSNRRNEGASGFSLSFGRVEKDPDSPLLILHEPVGPIPRTVEDHPDLKLRLYRRGQPDQSIKIDVVSIKDFTLRAKLRKEDWAAIEPAAIQRASIQVQSPAFLLDELVRQFNQLAHTQNFTADTNLQANLPAKLRFVFGPPGTGKTYHLAHQEIEQLMQQAEPVRILVLTPTNKAADVLTARLLPATEAGVPPQRPDWLFRYGVPADTNLEQVSGLVQDKNLNVSDLERCTVLTTAARFPYALCDGGHHYLAAVPWDYIILDEASMIPLYQAVNVIYQQPHCREFIIGGDPLQIPPVVHAEPWAGENIYTLVGLDNFDAEVTPQHQFPIHKLLTQRRATPPLGRLFSQFAYGGRLHHARPLTGTVVMDGHTYQGRRSEMFGTLPLGDITVIPFPVRRGEGIFEARKLDQGSNYHAYSALLAAELTRYLAQHIQPTPSADAASRYRVGIITPYTAQAALLRELLKQLPLPNNILNPNEDVGTIHGFQGDECNLIIALFAPPPTTGDRILLSYQHILNVAISRARDRLVLLVPEYEDDRASGLGLQRLRQLLGLLSHEQEGQVTHLTSKAVEQVLFGPAHEEFILSNSFTTSHQIVNVYGQGVARYELRFGPTAVDVQINLKAKLAGADIV